MPASQLVGKTAAKFLEDPSQASNVRDLLVSVLITETDETALNFTSSPREARNVMGGFPFGKHMQPLHNPPPEPPILVADDGDAAMPCQGCSGIHAVASTTTASSTKPACSFSSCSTTPVGPEKPQQDGAR